jgi:hypothetical protein
MNEQARGIIAIIRITADMGATIEQQDPLVALRGEPLRKNAARETGADNDPIKH